MTAPRLPAQPLRLDEAGVVRFVPNQVLLHLVNVACVDVDRLASLDLPSADKEQFWQLLGASAHDFGRLGFVGPEARARVEVASAALLRHDTFRLQWARRAVGWHQARWRESTVELRLERMGSFGTSRLSGRQAMELPWLGHDDPATGVKDLRWVARMDLEPMALVEGVSLPMVVGTLAGGKRRINDWCRQQLRGEVR